MHEKRILFTGGGTAGHVTVNLALIPYFLRAGWHVDYIGSYDGIERELITALENVTYYPISTGKLRRYMSIENFKDPFKVLKGTLQSWRIIRKTKPNIIFSKGGFVSVPVIVAARLCRVPTIIHESDLTPGLANKIAAPFAKKMVTTFPETVNYIAKGKATHVGAVVREELFQGDERVGYDLTKLHDKKRTVLIMGGSSGSQKINDIVRKNLPTLLQQFQVIHICGRDNVDETFKQPGYVQFEYVTDDLKHLFAITDLVISRAGANAIYEFLALKIPMLLIPLSLAASRGDQIDNARSFQNSGYAHVLFEDDMNDTSFIRAIHELDEVHQEIKAKMETYSSQRARDEVISLIEKMAKT
ncbi:MAG TPA: undecaprenyldiphospho-muramoylpentapeptide beta-N-acetylglucosaminyltransferase [Pseudogracilibacillus sp.]|nr:undecaprenyldiphospho-muramoylpentapeptide beta-N-acetylglucosaminyltransferase [Pseudogracilibacillus sp.]